MGREETGATEKKYLFSWDNVPGKDDERLLKSLRDEFDIGWAESPEIQKYDGRKTICISKGENSAKIIIIDEKEKEATLKISDGRTYALKVKKKNDKLYIYKKKREVYVLIKVKPKYIEQFCIMMVACRGLCNRRFTSKNLAEIDEVFSVLAPFDFLLKLSGEGKDWEEMDVKINKTIFKIRETLGNYINETCTLTEFELSDHLEDEFLFRWDKFPGKDDEGIIESLKNKFDIISWEEDLEPHKSDDDKTIYIRKGEAKLSKITIDEEKNTATLKISDKEIYDLKVERENSKRNIYNIYKYSSKGLFEKAESFETGELECFKKFLGEETFDKLDKVQEKPDRDTAKIHNLWENNKHLFNLDDNYEKYLKGGSVNDKLKKEFKDNEHTLSDKAKLLKIDKKNCKIVDDTKRYGIYDNCGQLQIYKIITKDVHVLIKVKPEYTEEFFVGVTLFKSLCNRVYLYKNLAEMDGVCSMLGPYDFLLKIVGEGGEKEEEKIHEKINKTILNIRETLGSYICETLTIEKFKIPMTKEELEKLFEKLLGETHLAKLPYPYKAGEKIPDECYESNDNIDLKEIYDAETTSLKKLLECGKTFLELEYLNERIDGLTDRVEKLEKKRG